MYSLEAVTDADGYNGERLMDESSQQIRLTDAYDEGHTVASDTHNLPKKTKDKI